jgi:hypothetical protein
VASFHIGGLSGKEILRWVLRRYRGVELNQGRLGLQTVAT